MRAHEPSFCMKPQIKLEGAGQVVRGTVGRDEELQQASENSGHLFSPATPLVEMGRNLKAEQR